MTDFVLDGGDAFSFSGTQRWIFYDYWNSGPTPYYYQWEINPSDGGSPEVSKNLAISQNVGPNRMNLVQEGQSVIPTLQFSGTILTQQQYETLELWFDRRVLIEMSDDLHRTFYGVFSKFAPKRARRPRNPWYHTYDAEFAVTAYVNASGQRVYGRIL